MGKIAFIKEVVVLKDEKGRAFDFIEVRVFRNENEFSALMKEIAKNKEIIKIEQAQENIEKERIRQEEEKAKFKSHSCLIASLLIENKIAKGELDEPDGYEDFIKMVEDCQRGGLWDDSKIPGALLDFFPFLNTEVAQ